MFIKETANIEAVAYHLGDKPGAEKELSELIFYLFQAWDNAATIEAKDNICRSEILPQIATPTTLSVIYRLYFKSYTITVLKVLVSELYDPINKQANISVVDDVCLILGVELVAN